MNYQTHHPRRSPPSYRGGPPPHRAFDSPPRHSPGGFRPLGGAGGGGFGPNHQDPPPLSGQKRGFSRGGSPDRFGRGSFAKLFVGSVPRTTTEEDIRPLFEEHGDVIEVALIKDRKTGQQQGTLRGRWEQEKAHLSSQFVFATSFTLVGFACNLFFMSVLSKKKKARHVNQLKTSFRIAVGILEDT